MLIALLKELRGKIFVTAIEVTYIRRYTGKASDLRDIKSRYYRFSLFVFRLNVPVNNFSVMSGRSHRFLGITSTFGE